MAADNRGATTQLTLAVDTNIIFDAVLRRQQWMADSVRVLDAIADGRVRGWVAAHAITTVYYVVARERDRSTAEAAVSYVLQEIPIIPLGTTELRRALALGITDYKDAVRAAAALAVGADYIVTRNEREFRASPVPARSPDQVLALL